MIEDLLANLVHVIDGFFRCPVRCIGVRVELSNGVVILLPPDLDGQRLGDVIMAADQIERSPSRLIADQQMEVR